MDKFDLNSKLFWWTAGPRYMPEGQAPGRRLLGRSTLAALALIGVGFMVLAVIAWLRFPLPLVAIPLGLIGLALLWMAFGGWRERHLFREDRQPRS